MTGSRVQLQREIAREARRRHRRRYGFTVGAVGGALGLSGVAVLASGVLTVGTVADHAAPPAPFVPAAADEIVTRVATQLADSTIPAGMWRKATVTFEQTQMLQPPGSPEPFDWVRTGALGSMTTRWITSSYISADGAQPIILESSSFQPIEANGDKQAVHDAWDSYYGAAYGNWRDIIDTPRPPTTTDSGLRSDLQGATDPSRTKTTPSEMTGLDGKPLVEGEGVLSSDPSEYLDALAAGLGEDATREDAIGQVFSQLMQSALTSPVPIDSQQLSFYLQAIALSENVHIESVTGGVTTLRYENDDAVRRLVVNTDTLVEASEQLKRTSGVYAEREAIGESPFLPADAPTSVFRFTQEIVDAAPAVAPGG
ncbi:hypothetical protein CQ027_17330 [Microbacterium sp. MYb32]|nr:hypothetical protein CQ027_17330 [Microbacterium sp. MYb32]